MSVFDCRLLKSLRLRDDLRSRQSNTLGASVRRVLRLGVELHAISDQSGSTVV
jgi:hypothetical protein